MVSKSLELKFVVLLFTTAALILTLACGDDEPAEPTPDIAGAVRDALQSAQASQPPVPSGPSAEEITEQIQAQIQQSVQAAVQALQATQAAQPTAEQLAAQIQQERGGSRRVGSPRYDGRRCPEVP